MNWERRRIGPVSAASLVVGNMIGAGLFTTSGFALAALGDPRFVLLAWGVGGAIALCGALSYGALARRIPRSGGEYTFLSETMHPALGVIAGWVSLLAGFSAPIALAALVFSSYLDAALPERWVATVVIAIAGLVHALRLEGGVLAQNVIVVLKLLLIAAITCWSGALVIAKGSPPITEAAFDPGAFFVTLVWISFAYSGWNGAIYLGSEIREPTRNLPRALWLPTLLVVGIYLAMNSVFVLSAPAEALAGRPDIAAAAASALGGMWLQKVTALVVALALFTSISAMVMAGPRVYARMAHDGVLPAVFARGQDTPAVAIALQVLLSTAIVWIADLATLLGYLGFTLSLFAALTVFAAARLRAREGPERAPLPGYPVVPALFIGFTVAAAAFLVVREPQQAAIGAATALFGLVMYALARRRHL